MRGISRKGTVVPSPLYSKWLKLGKGKGEGNIKRLFTTNHRLNMELKVHKIENFFDSDFGICVISLLVMSKY